MFFGGGGEYWTYVFWFSPQILSETFLVRRIIQGDIIINVYRYLKYSFPRQILMKLEFSRRIFGKYSNIKFSENLSSGSRVVPCGRQDGRPDMAKLIVAFRNFENAPNNSTFCPHSVFMRSVWIWEQTAIISLYSINWLVFITETGCVYCAVRNGSLYIILRSAHTAYLCVLCGSENKQRLFPQTALSDWFL